MKKIVYVVLTLFLLGGISVAGYIAYQGMSDGEKVETTSANTFAKYYEIDVLQTVPIMEGDNMKMGTATDYGDGTYVVDVNGSTLDDYNAYLDTLEESGFAKYVDNGSEGLYGVTYNATYTKDDVVVTVVHMVPTEKTYISACYDLPLSDHLFYKDEYVTENKEGAKTTLSLMELYKSGNSFVIQLKNGHFIINDGGFAEDTPYLLDYLESLVSEGGKPIVEAWIISHTHQDHVGVMKSFVDNPKYAERLYVEGIYYNEPSSKVFEELEPQVRSQVTYMEMASKILHTTMGGVPKIYRPQTGQRYYFCDITIDIVFAQEQLHLDNYNGDFNDSSTWCMYNIEGQKFLLAGDADDGGMNAVMRAYDETDFKVDIAAVFHHGLNVRNNFTDFCEPKTVLYTTWKTEEFSTVEYYKRVEENKYLQESAAEYYTWKDGTVVLTFPYKVGEAVVLPEIEWIYNNGVDFRGNK